MAPFTIGITCDLFAISDSAPYINLLVPDTMLEVIGFFCLGIGQPLVEDLVTYSPNLLGSLRIVLPAFCTLYCIGEFRS